MSRLPPLKLILIFTLLFALCACSQNTMVHLYGRYLTDTQTNRIRQTLSAHGFEVSVNQLAFPTNISRTTLIYGMPMDRPQELNQIRMLARQHGWQLQNTQPLVMENSRDSSNAMALFLLPESESRNPHISVDELSFEYHSQGCDDQPQLSLTVDQRFQIIPIAGSNTESALLQGRWQVRHFPYLELLPDGHQQGSYYLEIVRNQYDMSGELQQLTLEPQQPYAVFGQCSFVFGQREP